MRVALYVLGAELVSIETGPAAHDDAGHDDDQADEDTAHALAGRARRPARAGAGSTLAAAELGAETALGFTRPWRHVETDDDPADTHGPRP